MADRLISIDTEQDAGEMLPNAVQGEIQALLATWFTDNGDGTWTLDLGA
mgnify:CR=1 FL=1